jgi:hypothetical protein
MRKTTVVTQVLEKTETRDLVVSSNALFTQAPLPARAQGLLLQMFTDPHLLEREDRAELARSLRACVEANPESSDLRVILGMALCVNFEVEDAIEELQQGVRLAPASFIAQLKLGELWMRLRVCTKAEHHTRQAALLARNHVQSELARKQAAMIRTLVKDGIERSGPAYQGPWHILTFLRKVWRRRQPEVETLAAADAR